MLSRVTSPSGSVVVTTWSHFPSQTYFVVAFLESPYGANTVALSSRPRALLNQARVTRPLGATTSVTSPRKSDVCLTTVVWPTALTIFVGTPRAASQNFV